MKDPMGNLSVGLLRELFPDLHTVADKEGVLVGRCPVVHAGDFEGVFHALETDDGWRLEPCDMGCLPAVIFESARVGRRTPGDDDDDAPPPKEKPKGNRKLLADLIIPFTREMLRADPPPRRYLLRDSNNNQGMYVQGSVGLFAAAGGAGKSSSFAMLGVCVATSLTWYGPGGWVPTEKMRVLYLAAEEDRGELERRIHYAARAAGATSDEDLDLIAQNLHAVPLAGHGVALSAEESYQERTGALPETVFAGVLRDLLLEAARAGKPYGLVLIDTLARFAGFDAEKDNASATRWVQIIESLTTEATGKPSVIISHHTKKRTKGDDSTTSDIIRGASALSASVRWAAVLEQQKKQADAADLLTLRIVKANGVAPQLTPLILCRDRAHEGALRIATPAEIASHEAVSSIVKTRLQLIENHEERILAAMLPGRMYSRNDLATLCGGKKTLVLEAVRQLLLKNKAVETRKGTIVLAGTGAGTTLDFTAKKGADLPGSRPSPPLPVREGGGGEPAAPSTAQRPLKLVKDPPEGTGGNQGTGNREPDPDNPGAK